MTPEDKKYYTGKMVDELPVLRKVIGMTQKTLADRLGLCRSTIANIERHRQGMTWEVFSGIVAIAKESGRADPLIHAMENYDARIRDLFKECTES